MLLGRPLGPSWPPSTSLRKRGPRSPEDMVASAAEAVASAVRAGYKRLVVNLVIPTDPVTESSRAYGYKNPGFSCRSIFGTSLALFQVMLRRYIILCIYSGSHKKL